MKKTALLLCRLNLFYLFIGLIIHSVIYVRNILKRKNAVIELNIIRISTLGHKIINPNSKNIIATQYKNPRVQILKNLSLLFIA